MPEPNKLPGGEHIEELRYRMFAALKWLLFFLLFGFALDAIGEALDKPKLGVGKPMLRIITDPVETQVRDFYFRRSLKEHRTKLEGMPATDEEEIRRIQEKLAANDNSLDALSAEERQLLLGAPHEMPIVIPVAAFIPAFGQPQPGAPKEIFTKIQVYPAYLSSLSNTGDAILGVSGTGAEYHPQGSDCGQYHGAFGYFGKDNNLGIKSDPTDPGADGQATGDANSAKGCQRNL